MQVCQPLLASLCNLSWRYSKYCSKSSHSNSPASSRACAIHSSSVPAPHSNPSRITQSAIVSCGVCAGLPRTKNRWQFPATGPRANETGRSTFDASSRKRPRILTSPAIHLLMILVCSRGDGNFHREVFCAATRTNCLRVMLLNFKSRIVTSAE